MKNPLKKSTLFLGLCLCLHISIAQSPYKLSPELDLPIVAGELTLFTINLGLSKKTPKLTPKDTIGLNMMDLPAIDRKVVYNWSKRPQRQSDFLLRSSPVVPLSLPLLAGSNSRHRMGNTYAIVLEGMLASYTITELSKLLVKRKRPYVYGKSQFNGNLFDKNSLKSFFSGHTSFTATNYFMGAKMFNDFYPESKLKSAVWGTAIIIPAITAWKRVKGGKHFITDVLTGYIVGALVGIFMPEIHRKL